MSDWLALNRRMWDERVPIHLASRFYDVPGFLAGRSTLRDFERTEMGPVSGLDLLHLQCHFGLDTLSWAREGARVTGLDFSTPAIAAARELAGRAGIEARFVVGDLHDAPAVLGGRFDVVYTGLGALNWLPDTGAWARVVAACLRPGGRLLLVEFHPFTYVFADEALSVEHDYFHRVEGDCYEDAGTYADPAAVTRHNRSVEWNHPLGDVVTALLAAGLELEGLREHDWTLFARWPLLVRDAAGHYRMPEGRPRIPLMYSLRARLRG